eukprot:7868670-Pyramimonas_sp.AAC.1
MQAEELMATLPVAESLHEHRGQVESLVIILANFLRPLSRGAIEMYWREPPQQELHSISRKGSMQFSRPISPLDCGTHHRL